MHSTTTDLPVDVDTSAVPPQPATVSYRCPVRAALDLDPTRQHLKAPQDPSELTRGEQTRRHVAAVRERLAEAATTDPSVIVIERNATDGVELTRQAMASTARLIVGAHLPTDAAAKRSGCATVLARADRSGEGGWYPVEIRRHLLTRDANGSTVDASPITDPHLAAATTVENTAIRPQRHNENGRQLAHQWRLLEVMGAVLPGQRAMGGVIDRHGELVWWVDLEDPRWPTRWTDRKVTMLEHYDHGFDFRLRTIAHQSGYDGPLMESAVPPVRIGECSSCPWEQVCLAAMEAVDHVSLIPRSTFDHYAVHKKRNITTRAQVAQLHWPTAFAMHGSEPRSPSVDLVALLDVTSDLPAATPIADLFRPAAAEPHPEGAVNGASGPTQLQFLGLGTEADEIEAEDAEPEPIDPDEAPDLHHHLDRHPDPVGVGLVPLERVDHVVERFGRLGIGTVADLSMLDPFTASYSGEPCGHLPTVIDQARAATAGQPFLRRGLVRAEVPRADVEIDVDMENVEDGVYLWGTFVSGHPDHLTRLDLRPGYHGFWDMDAMSAVRQVEVFSRFWTWLTEIQTACREHGLTFRAYCYTSAEHQKMLQILAAADPASLLPLPTRQEVDEFVGSARWVDVYEVVRGSLVVGHGLGLKKIAPLAGFRWRDDDAGGLQSMAWHREAIENPDPEVRAFNRSRLLAYNEDDVRATLAVRNWLSTTSLPSIEAWVPDGGPGS